MPAGVMRGDNPLYRWLDDLGFILTEHPLRVSGPFGDFDVEYHLDLDTNDEYALIGFMLPDDERIFVQLDDGSTYGILSAFRIYLDQEKD